MSPLAGLLFRPSAWRQYTARFDPALPPAFCLAELSARHWRSPALLRLLFTGYFGVPALLLALAGLAHIARGEGPGWGLLIGGCLGTGAGLALGASVGVAPGLLASWIASAGLGWSLGRPAFLLVDALQGVLLGVTLGLAAGAAGYAWQAVAGEASGPSPAPARLGRRLGAVVIGLVVSVLVLAALAGFVRATLAVWQWGSLTGPTLAALSSVIPALLFGLAVLGRVGRPRRALLWGLAFAAATTLMFSLIYRDVVYGEDLSGLRFATANLLSTVMQFAVLYCLPAAVAARLGGTPSGAWAGLLGGLGTHGVLAMVTSFYALDANLLAGAAASLIGLTLHRWRPILTYPVEAALSLVLSRAAARRSFDNSLLAWHPAFWDELQRLPLPGLEEQLVSACERDPVAGRAAQEALLGGPQRWAVQSSLIELGARRLARCRNVQEVARAHGELAAGELEGPASALWRSFSRSSLDVASALQQDSAYNQRLLLAAVEQRLDVLALELTRSSEPWGPRFRPIALAWRALVAEHRETLARRVEQSQELDNPYVFGLPLTEEQEIFVGRTEIGARLELLLSDRRRPPLLLHGQRRMGKTSLLNNLGRLLPSTVVPLFVDLQGVCRANDHAGLLYNLSRAIARSARARRQVVLPELGAAELEADPFPRFLEWLERLEEWLAARGESALLALDELEALDSALARGRFDEEDVLGLLRHLLQHQPRFKVLLAGSHLLEELGRWSSYLINVQLLHLGYLTAAEAQRLIEQPVQDFPLRYEPGASARIVELTRGHPALVQLLCSELVAHKNEQPPAERRLARRADVDAVIDEALATGSAFFADIEHNQVDETGRALLRRLACAPEGEATSRAALAALVEEAELDRALLRLERRELVEAADGGFRFQVELVRRWFATRWR